MNKLYRPLRLVLYTCHWCLVIREFPKTGGIKHGPNIVRSIGKDPPNLSKQPESYPAEICQSVAALPPGFRRAALEIKVLLLRRIVHNSEPQLSEKCGAEARSPCQEISGSTRKRQPPSTRFQVPTKQDQKTQITGSWSV